MGLLFSTVVSQAAHPTPAASNDVVISQVYGGGGNTGATYTHDFVELFNRGSMPVDLSGWSVQYAAAAQATWQKTDLSGVIPPGRYLLVQQAQGTGGSQALPPPDATGTIAMSQAAGKVALVTTTELLACGTAATPCFGNPSIRDFVGYGASAAFEGSGPAGTLDSNSVARRAGDGCVDTDDNATDFVTSTPFPRNSTAPAVVCLGVSTPTVGPSPMATRSATPAPAVSIHRIQGASHISPLVGTAVSGVAGIVTALRTNGFYLQDPRPDDDDRTSEGIFVFTSNAPAIAVGDTVRVDGVVNEFRPGCATSCPPSDQAFANLSTTQITSPTVTVLSTGSDLPTPVVIGVGGRQPPTTVVDDDANGSVETGGSFDPSIDGVDFYESLEGMRVPDRTTSA